VTFRVLYCFFVISHSRRRILHFNATEHPTAQWIVQQVRETFPEDQAPKHPVLDRDRKFSGEVAAMLKCLGRELIRTAYRSPWQKGMAKRWGWQLSSRATGSYDRAERAPSAAAGSRLHRYYHEDGVHGALNKETPAGRVLEPRPTDASRVVGVPRGGARHQRYQRQRAA
jgi:putative transposase